MNFNLGKSGSGKAIHPWDNLKRCPKCGSYPWIVGKDMKKYESGSPYAIICINKAKCDCRSLQSYNLELCIEDWNQKGAVIDNMKKYRLGYSYLFLADKTILNGDNEKIVSLSVDVVFKVYGKDGEELLCSNTDERAVCDVVNRKVYACDLFRCSVANKKNLYELIPQPELLNLFGNVDFEVVGYTKELLIKADSCMSTSIRISKEEFEDIFRNNFESFDTANNKSAQVPAYFTQEV